MKYLPPASNFKRFFSACILSLFCLSAVGYAAVAITTPSATSGALIAAIDWNKIKTDLENLSTEIAGVAAGTSVWSISGSDIYRNSNVGIGIATPIANLNVVSAGATTIRATSGSNLDSAIQLLEVNNSPQYGAEIVYEGTDNKLHIGVFDNSNVRDDAIVITRTDAYVGIGGQSNPLYPLHVLGQSRFDGSVGIGNDPSGSFVFDITGDARKSVGGSDWSVSSDIRLKNILGSYDSGLDEILALNPVIFQYKEDNPRGLPSEPMQYGLIAQEVQLILPEEVIVDPVDGYLNLNTSSLNLALINAIQELYVQNQNLQAEVEILKNTLK